MEGWLGAIRPGEPWCANASLAGEGAGAGPTEAARGAAGKPGALEQALAGLTVPEKRSVPSLVHHVVRGFDPCMVCTVH